jgi:type II secretory pathway predicted ATPase ExeA
VFDIMFAASGWEDIPVVAISASTKSGATGAKKFGAEKLMPALDGESARSVQVARLPPPITPEQGRVALVVRASRLRALCSHPGRTTSPEARPRLAPRTHGDAAVDWSHFGMDRPPFRPAVDAAAYFPAPSHEAALAALVAAFARREPAVLIDGPPGVGKSLVARKWLDDLLPDVPRAVLPNSHAERPADLLQALLFDLGQPYQGLGEQELRLAVTGHLLDATGDFPTVLVIDEAQNLSLPALEELRLLGNLETRRGSAAFAVLVAQPSLRGALSRPDHALVADRVAVRCAIEPLTAEESAAYLRHQVRAAGGDPEKVLDEAAAALFAEACGGLPRLLNRAAGLAFELAADAGAEMVDVEAAVEALGRLGVAAPEEEAAGEAVLLPHPARAAEPERAGHAKPAPAGEADERPPARGPKDRASRKRSG